MPTIDTQFSSNAASGHTSIANAFNDEQRTHYMSETVWRHRCESMVAQIADPSWFDAANRCKDEILYKLEPRGIEISAMPSDNQELKSKTPKQATHRLNFGEWAYTQCKWSKREINTQCDFDDYVSDVEEQIRREYDDYIEKLALLRMSMVSSCFNDKCGSIVNGSAIEPVKVDKSNSHMIPLMGDQIGKNKCDPRGHFVTWPRCEALVLSANEEVKHAYQGCCTSDVPAISGKTPKFGDTTVVFSDHVPFTTCPDGSRIYRLTHAPFGSLAYASQMAVSEVIDSESMEKHWGLIHRWIMKFGLATPVPWDFTNFFVKIKSPTADLELDVCA